MTALRIGVDARLLIRDAGGMTTYLQSILSAVPEDCPHAITLFDDAASDADCSLHQRFRTIHAPVAGSSVRVGANCMAPVWLHRRLPGLLHREGIDVFWGPGGYIPRRTRIPRVPVIHDLAPYRDEGRAGFSPWAIYYRWETGYAARNAARILTDSAATRDDVEHHFRGAGARTDIVQLGCSEDIRAEPTFPDSWRSLIPDDARVVLCVGAYQERRNVAVVVDALALLPADLRPTARLVLCGASDPPVADVEGRAREAGVSDLVVSLGRVTDAELEGLYARADVVAIPSLCEGFGLPALEAMVRGVPVIAADATALPEVVGDAGILLPPRDARAWADSLADMFTDADGLAHLQVAGRQRAEGFTWARTGAETLAVLEAAARDEAS